MWIKRIRTQKFWEVKDGESVQNNGIILNPDEYEIFEPKFIPQGKLDSREFVLKDIRYFYIKEKSLLISSSKYEVTKINGIPKFNNIGIVESIQNVTGTPLIIAKSNTGFSKIPGLSGGSCNEYYMSQVNINL